MTLNYDSPTDIKNFLQLLGMSPLKRWGQNFLISATARKKILDALELAPGQQVWEVGPGLGAMTHMILQAGHPLTVFEIDPGYTEFLQKEFGNYPGFKVVHGDVVKTWRGELQASPTEKVVGNLPYNAASAIIASFIENQFLPEILVTTVQKEMADRMTARVGEKNYSSFSVLCQSAYTVKSLGDLKKGNFYPQPEVTSTMVQMKRRPPLDVPDRRRFHILVRELYSSRRKTLRNNLEHTARALEISEDLLKAAFESTRIDLGRRAETLTVEEFASLAREVK